MDPLKFKLLFPQKAVVKQLGKISSMDIFNGNSQDFHPEGLFSTEIFGMVGTEERIKTFGYIDLRMPVLHPLLYKHIASLDSVYKKIMSGATFAKFDKKLGEFIPVKVGENGDTGMEFFISHIKEIQFKRNKSKERDFKIDLLEKYIEQNEYLLTEFLVLPAGLRDYSVTDTGKITEDEVNDKYRRLISLSSFLDVFTKGINEPMLSDPARYKVQLATVDLYEHFISLNDGKKKFVQNKWTKRALIGGTRNVITPTPIRMPNLKEYNDTISMNHTVLGLFQFIKGTIPPTRYGIKTHFSSQVFNPESAQALLIDKDTLKSKYVEIPITDRDNWLSDEGLENTLNKLDNNDIMNSPVEINGCYGGLVYDNKKEVKLVLNSDQVPEHIDKKYLRPVTYGELVYICIHDSLDKYPGLMTRYPITGLGSIYPSKSYVKTTVAGRKVNLLSSDWTTVKKKLLEYPKVGDTYSKSLQPHYSHISAMGGDYDGDKCSYTILWTDEALEEIDNLFQTREFYLNTSGKMINSLDNDIVSNVIESIKKT